MSATYRANLPMCDPAKWFGLVALTTLMLPAAQFPGFSAEPWGSLQSQMTYTLAQRDSALNPKAEADHLLQHGVQQLQRSGFRAALHTWDQAFAIYQAIEDCQGQARALTNLGSAYWSLNDSRQAITYYEQALL